MLTEIFISDSCILCFYGNLSLFFLSLTVSLIEDSESESSGTTSNKAPGKACMVVFIYPTLFND